MILARQQAARQLRQLKCPRRGAEARERNGEWMWLECARVDLLAELLVKLLKKVSLLSA